MNKIFKIICNDESDYNVILKVTDDGNVFELYTGDCTSWTEKNMLLGTLIDHGNGVDIKIHDNNRRPKLKSLDYDHAEYVRILLHMNNKHNSSFPVVYTVYEDSYNF
jgi:hypothetical protein